MSITLFFNINNITYDRARQSLGIHTYLKTRYLGASLQ